MALTTPYQPLPVAFVRGEGVWLWDDAGKTYLDGLAGIAVCNLGHCHPRITAVIAEQASMLLHTSNYYEIPHQQTLAKKLTDVSGMEQVFFANSGAEANEAAIKLARLYGHQRGIELPLIVVMERAFHGRTMATLSASANPQFQQGFEPLLPGFIRVPYNDIPAIQALANTHPNIAAILVEPVQGEGGVNVPANSYLRELRTVCDQHQWLLMLDEVQTGAGRTGQFYAYQKHQIRPDIVTTAKGLGNGFPIGACLASGPAVDLFQVGKHGSTFGGNPLACRVASTVIDIMTEEQIPEQALAKGQYCLEQLKARCTSSIVSEIRGEGLLMGVVLSVPAKPLLKIGLEQGLLFSVTAETVIRLAPPLIISYAEIDELVSRLASCLSTFQASLTA